MKNSVIALGIICFVALLISTPFLKSGLFTMHDDQQVARLYLYDQAFRSGQFPVRWVDGLGFGFGYPLFVFYPSLVYMLGQIVHSIGFTFVDSIKVIFFLSILLSGISIYLFAKELWGKIAGLTSALFYILVPYRALDVYVRGALAESFSFVWLPLVLLAFYKLHQTNKNVYLILGAVVLALLMITHNLIFLPFSILLAIYLAFLFIISQKKINFLFKVCLAFIYAAALSAFFWIPALLEKKYTIVDNLLLVNLANYNLHFVYPVQLWNWTWGFGGSSEGILDGISFKIGKLHIIISLFTIFFATLLKLKIPRNRLVLANWRLAIIFFVLFLFSALMTTFYSKFIWDMLPALGYLQFPWRFLTFTALFSSLLAGAFIYFLKLPVLRILALFILLILLLIPNVKLFRPQFYRENLTDQKATSANVINWDVSLSSFEYLPKGVTLKQTQLQTNVVDIDRSDITQNKVKVEEGNATIEDLKSSPTNVSFSIDAQTSVQIKVNIFDFPGWTVKVNDKQVDFSSDNKLKLITFGVDAGKSRVLVEFKNTPVRLMSNLISASAIATLATQVIVYLIFQKRVTLKRA